MNAAGGRADALKRAFDLIGAVKGLVLLAPVFAVVAWRVRRELGSPVLFSQERPGLHGRIFTLRKFRTMTDERRPDGQLLPDEQRLTPFGRFLRSTSLDELPELLNVLRGEMSLVGPRPLLVEYLDLYSPEQARRHEVRPGITGWSQINGRNDQSWEDKLAQDVWYVDNRSLLLDLKILLRTLWVMATRRGVALEGHATTVRFTGSGDTGHQVTEPVRPPGGPADDLEIREATDDDLPALLELLQSSLGWVPDEQYADFFRWKHHENPFGRSPMWVALDDGRIVGFRAWLRWRFTRRGSTWEAVRAVDTATHPDYQGRGIFRRLTTTSVDMLARQGVAHVFNTPNEQSRPGYLKMGWEEVGKLPVGVRFRSPAAAARAVGARVPADKWSLPTDAGRPAAEALADTDHLDGLLAALPDARIRTDLDAEVLRWRYGFAPLHYRGLVDDDGVVLFRLRRRGPATECVVGHLLAPDPVVAGRLLRRVATESDADQVLQLTSHPHLRGGFLPLPGGGPVLTWRDLAFAGKPPLGLWDLTMGDVELF